MMKSNLLAGAAAALVIGLGFGALAASDKTAPAGDAKSGQSTADKTPLEKPAAEKAPQAEPVSTEPETTTASFGDWTLRCRRAAAAAGKSCEIFVDVGVQGQSGTVAEIAIGRLQKDQPYRVTVLLPVNVTLTMPGALTVEGAPPTRLELAWARCLPSGCFASAALVEMDLGHLRDGKAKASLLWQAGSGQGVSLPLSLRGFAQAFDSLNSAID